MFSRTLMVGCIGALAFQVSAHGALVQLHITGAFSGPGTGIFGNPLSGLSASSTYDATVIYDTSAAPSAGDGGRVHYDALQSMSITFHNPGGDVAISPDILSGSPLVPNAGFAFQCGVNVLANAPGDFASGDSVELGAASNSGPDGQGLFFYFDLFSGIGNHPLNGMSDLPLSISDSQLGGRSPFQFQFYSDFSNVGSGSILSVSSTLVPCPPVAAVLPLGCAVLARRRRRA